ncbi:MAG TPA: hypothetical protein VFK05_19595 [Polyangiaceae bacterium]|nr:hypothetical protein [Polyangiaceae bacterium]
MDQNPYAPPTLAADVPLANVRVPAQAMPWFAVGTRKLFAMCVLTLGLYVIFWFFCQYRAQKRAFRESTWPFARAFFAVLYAHELFRRVERAAKAADVQQSWTYGGMGVLFVVSAIVSRVLSRVSDSGPVTLLTLTMVFGLAYPVYRVQGTINDLLAREFGDFERNERFSVWNWLVGGLGALVIVAAVVGSVLP